MASVRYLDFDLAVERVGDGYCARVLRSPCGEAEHRFERPLSELELRDFGSGVVRHRAGMRGSAGGDVERVKTYGARLFETVFAGDVQTCLNNSLHEARSHADTGLRIRLRLNGAPELVELPWEYLYRSGKREFLALTTNTPIIRYLDLPESVRPLAVKPPLRILCMISSPSDAERLDVEAEWGNLKRALADLETRGDVVVDRLETATLDALRWRLREQQYHVFHYVGHAGFDPYARRGTLVLEDDDGKARMTSAEQLGVVLFEEDSLRLVVLNACEGARTAADDIFAGTAQTLVQKDVPAVVAMQFDISDGAAVTFARDFYRSLAFGDPVDTAVTQARQAIFSRNELEWGTPVLYMRASEGKLFDLQRGGLGPGEGFGRAAGDAPPTANALPPRSLLSTAERQVRPPTAPTPAASRPATPPPPAGPSGMAARLAAARDALDGRDWDRAIEILDAALAQHGEDAEARALLRRAREGKELATVYAAGLRHENNGEWREAFAQWSRLRALAPGGYRDGEERFARVQQELARAVMAEEERERREQALRAPGARAGAAMPFAAVPPPQETWRPAEPAVADTGRRVQTRRRRWAIGIGGVVVLLVVGMIWAAWAMTVIDRDGEMAKQGFEPYGEPIAGSLRSNERAEHELQLEPGVEYRVAGACDQTCDDMDLELVTSDGTSVAEDVAPDPLPTLPVTVEANDTATLHVHMRGCSASPCEYRIRLYGRPIEEDPKATSDAGRTRS